MGEGVSVRFCFPSKNSMNSFISSKYVSELRDIWWSLILILLFRKSRYASVLLFAFRPALKLFSLLVFIMLLFSFLCQSVMVASSKVPFASFLIGDS